MAHSRPTDVRQRAIRARDTVGGSSVRRSRHRASPVYADGKIYCIARDGVVTVLKAGAQWEVLGVNDIGEPIHATPALAGGRIYVRTRSAIYCFGAK